MEKKGKTVAKVSIRCSCGAQVVVDARSRGVACPSCKAPLRPNRVTVTRGTPVRRGGKPRPPAPPPSSVQEIVCRCGERLQVRPEYLGKLAQCPRCGVKMKLEKVRDPQTLHMGVRAAEVPAEGPPPPQPGTEKRQESGSLAKVPTGARPLTCRCGARLMVTPELLGKEAQCPQCGLLMRVWSFNDPATRTVTLAAEPVNGAGHPLEEASVASQEILCQCGEHLLVRPEHVGKQVQCAACGTIMQVQKTTDPVTQAPILQARVVGKVDLDSWSLDDFK
jgi:predicted RNA-binding Zn-ribbon protein involved in translation (DUF1610 family)